jgi:hypothetical protein
VPLGASSLSRDFGDYDSNLLAIAFGIADKVPHQCRAAVLRPCCLLNVACCTRHVARSCRVFHGNVMLHVARCMCLLQERAAKILAFVDKGACAHAFPT